MHTNYKELGKRIAGPAVCPLVHGLVSALCGIHCHKVHLPSPLAGYVCFTGLLGHAPFLCLPCAASLVTRCACLSDYCYWSMPLAVSPLLLKAPCNNPCIKLHLFWPIPPVVPAASCAPCAGDCPVKQLPQGCACQLPGCSYRSARS